MTPADLEPVTPVGTVERSRLVVSCGDLARALAGRFVAALGAETELGLDRVEEAVLVAEAAADRCGELTPSGDLEIAVSVHERRLELRVGPLEPGAARRLLAADAARPGGGAIRRLASSVETRRLRSDAELLVVVVGEHADR